MRNWAFWGVASALVVIGCGGGGGRKVSNTGGGTIIPGATRVKLDVAGNGVVPPPLLYTFYLTGQGRTAGDLHALISRADFTDSLGHQVGYSYGSAVDLSLANFFIQDRTITVGGVQDTLEYPITNSVRFDQYSLSASGFYIEPDSNSLKQGTLTTTAADYAARIRLFPGRDSYLPIYLNDAMLTYNGTSVDFDSSKFEAVNLLPDPRVANSPAKLRSFLSDYVRFDLSDLVAQDPSLVPTLQLNGQPAQAVFFSGDGYAISDATSNQPGNFEVLTFDPQNPIDGQIAPPHSSSSTNFPGFPGTYNLTQASPTWVPDPNNPLQTAPKITSLLGRWRNAGHIFSGSTVVDNGVFDLSNTTFDIILFPNSDEEYDSNRPGDIVAIVHNGDKITNMYYGFASLTEGTFNLFPIKNLVTGAVDGEVSGTMSTFKDRNGNSTNDEPSVRSGKYTFTSDVSGVTGFKNTGSFVVFRY